MPDDCQLERVCALLDGQKYWCLRPTLLEVIKGPELFVEDVNDYVGIIHQDPPGHWLALDFPGTQVVLAKILDECAADRTELPFVLSRAYDKEIGNRRKIVNIDHSRVGRRSFTDDIGDRDGKLSTLDDGIIRRGRCWNR